MRWLVKLQALRRKIQPVELALIFVALGWVQVLVYPPSTFATSRSYSAMANLAPEGVWTAFICMAVILQIAGLFGGYFHCRRAGLLMALFIWTFVASMLFISNPDGTGHWAYATFAFMAAYAYWKVGEQRHG